MYSFILPTRDGDGVARTVAADAAPEDELLVVCDAPSDPVADAVEGIRESAGGTAVELVVAGEPEGCSAKCNALAAGIERADGELLVWTDDDFDHGGWVDGVERAVDDHVTADSPAVSTIPVFLADGWFGRLAEGPSAVGAAIGLALETTVWGGTVAFRRDAVDVEALAADLRRTVTDDALLTRRLPDYTCDPRLVPHVHTEGTLQDALSRNARWVRTARFLDPGGLAFGAAINLAVTVGAILAPLLVVPLVTLLAASQYVRFGVRRASFLWTVPGYVVGLALLVHGLLQTEFDWGSRRYRWRSLYDVDVLDRDGPGDTAAERAGSPRSGDAQRR